MYTVYLVVDKENPYRDVPVGKVGDEASAMAAVYGLAKVLKQSLPTVIAYSVYAKNKDGDIINEEILTKEEN